MPVYVVGHSPRTGPVKIGYAGNLDDRLRALRRGETCPLVVHQRFSSTRPPSDLALLHSLDGDRSLEREIHLRLRDFRIEGEWFSLGTNPAEVVDLVGKAAELTRSSWRAHISGRSERQRSNQGGAESRDAPVAAPSETEIRANERRVVADLVEARFESAPNADQREALRGILEVLRPETWHSGRW